MLAVAVTCAFASGGAALAAWQHGFGFHGLCLAAAAAAMCALMGYLAAEDAVDQFMGW